MATGGTSMIGNVITWLNDPSHWRGTGTTDGIVTQLERHISYVGIALLIAMLIAVPLGLLIGHTGRGGSAVSVANAIRSIPSIGLLILLVVIISPHFHGRTQAGFIIPTEIVLMLLAVPPILAGTYAGVENVDPTVRDAAYGMGMKGGQVLLKVEVPNALPLIFSGVRSAALQLIATATIASFVPLGGLGRFIYDGLAQRDFPQMIGGGVLVAALALLFDLLLAAIQRVLVSPGVSRRFSKRADRRRGAAGEADSRVAALDEAEVAA